MLWFVILIIDICEMGCDCRGLGLLETSIYSHLVSISARRVRWTQRMGRFGGGQKRRANVSKYHEYMNCVHQRRHRLLISNVGDFIARNRIILCMRNAWTVPEKEKRLIRYEIWHNIGGPWPIFHLYVPTSHHSEGMVLKRQCTGIE